MVLHGIGEDQEFLTYDYLKNRRKGLEDRDKLTAAERTQYDISGADGGGRTDPDRYEIKQFPFPTDPSIRSKKTIDVRKVMPELGEQSDV